MFEGDYYIDVGIDNNDFKLILRDSSGNIVKVFDDSDSIINQAWREVSQLIENYDIMLYGRVKTYRDGDFIFDLFKRFLFIISIEQDASYLASLDGYRIKYPEFTYYVATLYKLYKAFVNPRSTLSPQDFVLIISPLLTKVRLDISGQELVNLFDTFAMNYYRAIDYINKERIGLNEFMFAAERPMITQPNTIATQPNAIAVRPSTTVNQPRARSQRLRSRVPIPRPVNNPPRVVLQRSPVPPRVTPREKPEVTQLREETNQPKLEERKISLEEKEPLGPPTIEEEPFDETKQEETFGNTQQEGNLENRQEEISEETSGEVPEE
jgi:hypothetical protein